MSKDFSVHIHGLKSLEEANEFCRWYSGQGEQTIDFWLEVAKEKGKDVRTDLTCKSIVSHPIDNCVVMYVGK